MKGTMTQIALALLLLWPLVGAPRQDLAIV